MKLTFILVLTIFTICSYAQFTQDLVVFKKETAKIMDILGISIRTRLEKDDSITIHLKNDFALNASFGQHQIGFIKRDGLIDSSARWYIKPSIDITPLLDSIISKKIDTSKKVYTRACCFIIHELTHYFQKSIPPINYFEPNNNFEYNKYISQQTEFEAYAVGSYYFLKKFNKRKLNKIMRLRIDKERRFKYLINAFWEEVYPWRPLVF